MNRMGEPRVAVVIEDDEDIRNLLQTVLSQAGFQVVGAANGADGVEAVRQHSPVVTTLDVNMAGMDGFETARRIRVFSPTYIIMLTALSEEIDTLQGLEAGADDYISKPFRPRELRARIEAMLRRPRVIGDAPYQAETPTVGLPAAAVGGSSQPSAAFPGAAPGAPAASVPAFPPFNPPQQPGAAVAAGPQLGHSGNGWLEHNGLWLNVETRVVQLGTQELELTRSEFELLAALMESGRRVRTKADLVLLLRGESYVTSHFISEADKRAIEVHMGNLRKKLGDNIGNPRWIETVRGVGYRLTAADA